MTHQRRRRRRHSAVCHLHPSSKPTTGFCASCLRERLSAIQALSSTSAQVPELRRVSSYSVRDASASVFDQPRRRSCDVSSNYHPFDSIQIPDLEDEGQLVEEEEEVDDGELKTMKELIDLESKTHQINKNNVKDSIFSRTLKKFSLRHHKNGTTLDPNRHSCDVDPRLSLDAGRISLEEPRASWDIGKTYPKLTPLSTVTEEAKTEEKPGGTAQTRDYYLDSRRRRSFDPSSSRLGLLEVDELKAISSAKVSPQGVGLFHGAKLLVTESELRDSNWYSIKDYKPESLELGCVAAGEVKQEGFGLKKNGKKWSKGWNLWGLIQRKTDSNKNEETSLKLGGNAVEGSLAESLLKLRRVSIGDTNGDVSEKLIRSYSVSARKSCDDGMYRGASIVNGFQGGRSSCDGLFHGSFAALETVTKTNLCDDEVFHGVEGKQKHLLRRDDTKLGTYSPDNLRNGMVRFYLTPLRSHSKSRLMN